jgi:hypothetical protein
VHGSRSRAQAGRRPGLGHSVALNQCVTITQLVNYVWELPNWNYHSPIHMTNCQKCSCVEELIYLYTDLSFVDCRFAFPNTQLVSMNKRKRTGTQGTVGPLHIFNLPVLLFSCVGSGVLPSVISVICFIKFIMSMCLKL